MGNQDKGRWAELHARAFLLRLGNRVVAHRYRWRSGEIDVVAQSPQGLWLFVEVKSVLHPGMGHPNRRIGFVKQERLWRTAVHFLHFHGGTEQPARFDVITIDVRRGRFSLQYYPGAFEGKSSVPIC